MKWSDIIKDKRYQDSNVDVKDRIKKSWYDSNIKSDPRYTPEQDSTIRNDIFGKEPEGPSFRSARLGTEIVDKEINFHGKKTKLSDAVRREEAYAKILESPWTKANVPLVAVGKGALWTYEQTFGRLLGGYHALLANKSPLEGIINPKEQLRPVDLAAKHNFATQLGVPENDVVGQTAVNGLVGWTLDLVGLYLLFDAPFKVLKGAQTAYTGAQGKAVTNFKTALQSELEIAGVPKNAAKQQADILFYEQWVKTGMLKKTPHAINQSAILLKSNPGKLGEFIKANVDGAKASAAQHGYTPEVLKRIPKLSGKTTYTQLAEGDVLMPAKGSMHAAKMGEFKEVLKGVKIGKGEPSQFGTPVEFAKRNPAMAQKGTLGKLYETVKRETTSPDSMSAKQLDNAFKTHPHIKYGDKNALRFLYLKDEIALAQVAGGRDALKAKIGKNITKEEKAWSQIDKILSGTKTPVTSKVELTKPDKGIPQVRTIAGVVRKSGYIDPTKAKAAGWSAYDIKKHKNVMKQGGQSPDALAEQMSENGELAVGDMTASERLKEALDNKEPTTDYIESQLEAKMTKPLTPAERLMQIKTSHMAFKARKASDTLKEVTSKQEPVKVTPPEGKTSADMNSSPHIPLKSGTKPEPKKPFVPEDRVSKNMYQVTLQTPKGATITYVSEESLIKMKEAIRTAPITKELPKHEGIPVTKIHDEQLLNLTEMHLGVNPGPALREAKRLYEYMEKMADPVRTAPPEVARTIRQRGIAQNMLIHNIAQVKSAMQRLVPDPKQQEIITAFIEPNGEAAVGDQMTDNMHMVADLIMDGQKRLGTIAKKHGVIKVVLANYMKHMVKDPLLTPEEVDAKIKWALSTGKISKFVESKMPRIRGEDGEMIFPTVASLEAAGYDVVTKNAIDLYDFTMRSEGLAVINAEMADKLRSIRYVDPRQPKEDLKQLMTLKGKNPPRGYKLLRRGVFTQQWASPEAYDAISAVAEPAIGGRAWSKLSSTSKRIKFLFPFLHAWNLWRNAVETRGIPGSFKMIAEGAKRLEDPERVSQILKMGVNLFQINKMSGGITDEFAHSLGKWDLPAKTSEWLFCGLGDSVAAGMTGVLEQQLAKAGFSGQEANEILSEIVNTLSGNLGPETMSRGVRDMGRVMLLARNWTLSNIREGKGALLGSMPKYWSKEQKGFGQKWYQSALLRGFAHLFTAANVINYISSKHSYGKGRFTWENTGRWDFKIAPLLWVDKRTGKEYYATGWYGSLGDIMHWFSRPVQTLANKLNIPVKEGSQQLFNTDFFTREKIARDSDTLVEGMKHRIGHAAENFLTPAGIQLQIGKYPVPMGTKILRFFGVMLASSMKDQDIMKKMYNFKEKKKYKVQDIDRGLYKKLAEGDKAGFMKEVAEKRRYETIGGASGMIRKFENPLKSYFNNLGHRDRREFLKTLSPSEKERLGEAIRRRRQ